MKIQASIIGFLILGSSLVGCGRDHGAGSASEEPDSEKERDDSVADDPPPPAEPQGLTAPVFLDHKTGLGPEEIAVIVNTNDPQSVAVAAYYKEARHIPDANIISIQMTTGVSRILRAEFNAIKAQVDAAVPSNVQAFALTWTTPYAVEGMAITSAFALGFAQKYFSATFGTCATTAAVSYYDHPTARPFADLSIRPAMMLAGTSVDAVKSLIDRGVMADKGIPAATSYMLRTSDAVRSLRISDFTSLAQTWSPTTGITASYLEYTNIGADYITNKPDVLFYFQGLRSVPAIETNTYMPGAIADHLTSYGGFLTDSSQMSSLNWLTAGATGSFGTVEEPCAYAQKFPRASVVMAHYLRGESLVEAYWKSVLWPGEGVFIGEPLAKPFGKSLVALVDGKLQITARWPMAGHTYQLEVADSVEGPYAIVQSGIAPATTKLTEISVEAPKNAYYRLIESH